MTRDLVLGVDSSTTATKAIAYDSSGHQLGEGRCAIALDNPGPGLYEQDCRAWWTSCVTAIRKLGRLVDLGRVATLAIANQRETVCFLSDKGEPLAPAITWLDERCTSVVDSFAAEIGADRIHHLTGKHKDNIPVVYVLAWVRDHQPELLASAASFCDVQAYLVSCLTGNLATSWASADPHGYWDMAAMEICQEILTPLGLDPTRFPAIHAPATVLGTVTAEAAAATGLSTGTPVAAGGGDGQCAGLGVGVVRPGSAYLNLGTAVVCGAHQSDYSHGDHWRTMTSMSGEGYIMESVLGSGTFLVNWLVREIFGTAGKPQDFAKLEAEAARLAPGSDGLHLLPYWLGVHNPHWDASARGAIFGLAGRHKRAHLYRAVLEGIALDQAVCLKQLQEATGVKIAECFAVGGGSNSDLWCQIFADLLDVPVRRMDSAEASALGAAMAASVAAGFHPDLITASDTMRAAVTASFTPGQEAAAYRKLGQTFDQLYPATQAITRSWA